MRQHKHRPVPPVFINGALFIVACVVSVNSPFFGLLIGAYLGYRVCVLPGNRVATRNAAREQYRQTWGI